MTNIGDVRLLWAEAAKLYQEDRFELKAGDRVASSRLAVVRKHA